MQVRRSDLVAAKGICELVLPIEDGDGRDGLATLGTVADASESVKEVMVFLFFVHGALGNFSASESTFFVSDVSEDLVHDDRLIETAFLLGFERDEVVWQTLVRRYQLGSR
jgi:hypothetical protein